MFSLFFNRLIAIILRRYLIIFVSGLFYFRAVIFYCYCFIYGEKFNIYVILTKALRRNFIFLVKIIRISNFAARFNKYKFINGTFILLFITFLNVFLYVLNTLRKYCACLLFKFLITFVIFNSGLYYTVTPKLIINQIIVIYIYLTRVMLYFYVNVISLINIIRYIINLAFKAFL